MLQISYKFHSQYSSGGKDVHRFEQVNKELHRPSGEGLAALFYGLLRLFLLWVSTIFRQS
jgi:hypothetical protein